MPISWFDLNGSVDQLATYTGNNPQATARSLMFMIQYTSEAARFYDVEGIMRTAMRTDQRQQGLPDRQQSLENNWGQISQYAYDVTNNPSTPPRNIGGVGTFNSFNDVARTVPILLGSLFEVTGSFSHDEL